MKPLKSLSLLIAGGALLASSLAAAESYTLFIYETNADIALRADTEKAPAYWAAYAAFSQQLEQAGVLRGGAALQPDELAHTVRLTDGKPQIQAGAHARSREPLGGYFVIDVADLAAATAWAEKAPGAATGAVEVRPAYPAPTMR